MVIEFARQQAMAGRRVAILCRQGPNSPEARTRLEGRWRGLGIECIELGDSPPGGSRRTTRELIDRLKPEIVHVHCIWEPIVRHACGASAERGIPYLISTHGMLHPTALASKRWKKRAYLAVFPGYLRRAAGVFSLNREEADHVRRRFNPNSSVLPNGIEASEYERSEDGSFRRLVPTLGDRPFILFVGRLHPIKGLDLLLRSFAHALRLGCACDLVMVGPDEGSAASLRADIRRLGLEGRVHMPGGLFGDEKRDAFAACALFAHRPRFEGFGITVAEALAAGKPVVTTVACRLDGAAAAGAIVQAADTDEGFGEALACVLADPVKARRLGEAGRAWVRNTLDWQALVTMVDRAYAEAGVVGADGASGDGRSGATRSR